jgi:hypothetical protein
MKLSSWILVIFLVVIIIWFVAGATSVNFNLHFGKSSENMIDEAQWLEVPRGFNEPNGGIAYKPLKALWQIENAAHVDQVRLDPTTSI